MHLSLRLPARLPVRLLVFGSLLLAVAIAKLAAADPTTEGQFVADTNQARADHGLAAYTVHSDLTSVARRWAAYMASHHTLAHNPNYTSEVCCWRDIGENVGVGASVSQIQNAFMASAPHRDNILSGSFTQVGIGTARSSDGRLWVDELFRRPNRSEPVAAPVRAQAPVVSTHVAAPRASRSAHRARIVVRRHPAAPSAATVLDQRLATAVQETARRPSADPVMGAWAFVQVMDVMSGSAG